MIIVKDLYKNFTTGKIETKVLKGISLHIKPGEFVAIMGKSGAGKSTLMYQMSLLDQPTSGFIQVDGVDSATLNTTERTEFRLERLGYVFQSYALLPELSAQENVMVPLLMQGMGTSQAKEIAQKSLEEVELGHRLGNRPSQLSGGEQQRVSVARAVAHNPKILFADEPTANLDNVSSHKVLEVFKKLHENGQTIVMVTHEDEYAKYAERVIYLEDGKLTDRK